MQGFQSRVQGVLFRVFNQEIQGFRFRVSESHCHMRAAMAPSRGGFHGPRLSEAHVGPGDDFGCKP